MTFTNISNNAECACLRDSYADVVNIFARKVRKAPDMKEGDFRSNFEKDRLPETDSCDDICGIHGVSVEIWNEESAVPLLEKYQTTANYSPKYKNNLSIFKLKDGAGVVKYTPNQKEYNEFHYDLYKEDFFTIDHLDLVEMIPLIPTKDA